MSVPGFREHHEQMQSWLMWFIDGASYIDVDDERWQFFVVYEKTPDTSTNGCSQANNTVGQFHFVGYCSVSRYYAYPDKERPRISQFLILPPFQRQGLGAHLLQTVYDCYCNREQVVDVAVEDPADNFTRLRDFVDARNCSRLPQLADDSLPQTTWSSALAQTLQQALKLNRTQARRVFEILKLRATNRSDAAAYRAFRLEVKRRLNAPFLKSRLAEAPVADEVRVATLHKMYEQTEQEYLETIEKLAAAQE